MALDQKDPFDHYFNSIHYAFGNQDLWGNENAKAKPGNFRFFISASGQRCNGYSYSSQKGYYVFTHVK
jgi:hypothetical protein